MALTEERRNEIAWKFFVHHLRNRGKVFSVAETCKYLSKEYRIPSGIILTLAVENAYDEILFPADTKAINSELVAKRNERIWYLHVLYEFKKGVKISESFIRDVGNWANDIGVEKEEFREYFLQVIQAIVTIITKNTWWIVYESEERFLEVIKEALSETSKVNSAETGS